jgi:FKBP-type peptidyl-prolyl cis-trans isomerase (trigger factor)
MRSTSEALEGNRVKLTVEVDEEELRGAVDETIRRLQKEVAVPGFRPGKVPRRLLEVRLGAQAIRSEVIRHALPDYYAQAVEEADLDTIAAPEIDITAGEDAGALAFAAVVEVRPKVSVLSSRSRLSSRLISRLLLASTGSESNSPSSVKSNDRLEMAIWSRSMCKAFATARLPTG